MKATFYWFAAVVVLALSPQAFGQQSTADLAKPIELWPDGAPGATGASDEDRPAIIPVLPPATNNTGAAILICPGGGFRKLPTRPGACLKSLAVDSFAYAQSAR